MTPTNSPDSNNQGDQVPKSEYKQNMDLISNWYQSYYLWNSAYMANAMISSDLVTNRLKALNPSQNTTNQSRVETPIISTNARTPPTRDQTPPRSYKVPSLAKRFMAEFFDAVYIQCCKIVLAIILLNYTDLM